MLTFGNNQSSLRNEGRRPGNVIAQGEALGKRVTDMQALKGRHHGTAANFYAALTGLIARVGRNPGRCPGLLHPAPSALKQLPQHQRTTVEKRTLTDVL